MKSISDKLDRTTMAVLVNLARRAHWAKHGARRAIAERWPEHALRFALGVENGAWNTLQIAKQIAFKLGEFSE